MNKLTKLFLFHCISITILMLVLKINYYEYIFIQFILILTFKFLNLSSYEDNELIIPKFTI